MTPLRVLHLARGREWRGGERQVRLLAHTQRSGGEVDPSVLTGAGSALAEALAADGVRTLRVRWRVAWDPRALWQAARLTRAWRRAGEGPALLHAHDSHALLLGLWLARRERLPIVATRRSDTAPGPLWRRLARVLGLSDAVCARLRAAGLPAERIVEVPSAIDLDALAPLATARRADPNGILAAGALTGEKGHRVLIDALAIVARTVPGIRLTLLGEGPERGRLAAQAAALGLGASVALPGMVPDVAARIAGAAVFVQPSLREALGTAVLEAMALGTPVVASATGGLTSLLGGAAGMLVPPGSPTALAAAILRLLADPFAAATMARRARDRARCYGSAGVAARVTAVYRSALIQS